MRFKVIISLYLSPHSRATDTRVWMMDEGKIPYEGQQGLENSQELL